MAEAYAEATDSRIRDLDTLATGNAAEILALRDWLVPEEACPYSEWHPATPGEITRWQERQRLRALLTAEADRAESNSRQDD